MIAQHCPDFGYESVRQRVGFVHSQCKRLVCVHARSQTHTHVIFCQSSLIKTLRNIALFSHPSIMIAASSSRVCYCLHHFAPHKCSSIVFFPLILSLFLSPSLCFNFSNISIQSNNQHSIFSLVLYVASLASIIIIKRKSLPAS